MRLFTSARDCRFVERVHCGRVVEQIPVLVSLVAGVQPTRAANAKDHRLLKPTRFICRECLLKLAQMVLVGPAIYRWLWPMPEYIRKHSCQAFCIALISLSNTCS